MTNIVTRKGLAFGALVALASTAIAGAPAQAAGELNVVPEAGTSLNIAAGSVFNLKTTFAPGYTPSSYSQLKYLVKTDANSAINAKAGLASVAAPQTGGTVVAVSTTSSAIAAGATAATDVAYLGLSAVTTSVTSAVEVTAFVDANNDGALTAGEWNTVKTVTFKKAADITPAVTLTAPSTGDTSVSATVAWGDLNIEQMSAEAVKFTVAGGAVTAGTLSSGTWSLAGSALAAGAAVTAQAYDGTTALGTAASATATARTINTTNGLVANVTAGNDSIATAATAIATGTAARVRTNGTFTAQVKAYDTTAGTALAKAGVAVVGKVTATTTATNLRPASTGVTEISVTVNGTKYTDETTLNAATVALTTDASGLASLTISSVGLVATDALTVAFSAQNITSSVLATAEDVAYTVTEANTATTRATLKNTAVAVAYTVKDQFGVKSAATNQRLVISATNSTTISSAAQYVAVAAGAAGATITPITDSTAAMVISATLQSSTYDATSGATTWAGAVAAAAITVNISSVAFDFTTAPALAGVAGAAYVSSTPTKQVVTQAAVADLAASAGANGNTTWASITVTGNTNGAAIAIAAPGAFISTAAGVAGVAESATLYSTGAAQTLYVASNTVGTKTVTFTIGAVSKTVDVVFTSGAASTALNLSVAATAAAQAGRAIDATVTVTDKFGNPIAGFVATATVSGVALVNGAASADVTTDANGKATVKLSAGVNDLGDAVITFADKGTNAVSTTAPVAAVAKTVAFGYSDGWIDVLNGKRASVTWNYSKGKRVAFYLDGVRKYNFVQTGDAEMNLQFNLKKGSHTIKLVIGGVVVDTLTVKIAK